MNTYLVYYVYHHNTRNANEFNTTSYVENTDVRIAKVIAENRQEAENTCIDDLNLYYTGYIINTIKI